MIDVRRAAINRPEDHRALSDLYHALIDAWNRKDSDEVAGQFSAEAEFIWNDGVAARGSEGIRVLLAQLFRDNPATGCAITEIRTRKTSFHVGVLHGQVSTLSPAPARVMLQTLVGSSEHGFWQVESFQSTEVSAPKA